MTTLWISSDNVSRIRSPPTLVEELLPEAWRLFEEDDDFIWFWHDRGCCLDLRSFRECGDLSERFSKG